MCYVIENFEGKFPVLKWHPRVKALFFLRNANRFNSLLMFLCTNYSTSNLLTPSLTVYTRYSKIFFNKMFFRLPNRLSVKTSLPLVINLLKSFQYWALQNSLQYSTSLTTNNASVVSSNTTLVPLSRSYYLTKKMTLLRLRRQPYKLVMFTFIQFMLSWWTQFNIYNKLPTASITLTAEYTTLRYYNAYFFKIYTF